MEALAHVCSWLAATAISQDLQSVGWVVPTVQSVHILGIAMVVAPTILMDLRLLGVGGEGPPVARLFASLMPVVWWALLALLLSGLLLIVAEPRRELLNVMFWSKMALLAVALTVTAGLQRWSKINAPSTPPGVRAAALLSLALFVAIIGCGRWIAYV